jgi:hypothetical protein
MANGPAGAGVSGRERGGVGANLHRVTAPGGNVNVGTFPFSINTAGTIAGYVGRSGFVGTAGGTITTFDVSGAIETVADSINSAGVIAGHWADANAVNHGFVRSAEGTITTLAAPGAGTGRSR